MALSTSQTIQKEQVKVGSVLLEGGEPVKLLVLVHEGQVSAMNEKLSRQRRYMYTMGKNSIPGFSALLKHTPASVSYIAQTPVLISAFPISGRFHQLIMGKLNLGFIAVRSLLNEIFYSYQMLTKLIALSAQILKVTDSTALAYEHCLPSVAQSNERHNDKKEVDPVAMAARVTAVEFEQNGGQYPDPITNAWLQTDWSNVLGSNYHFTSKFDPIGFQFFRKLLSLPANLQSSIYQTDLSILEGLSHQLKSLLNQNIEELYTLQETIDTSLGVLLHGDYSYAEKLHLISANPQSKMIRLSVSEITEIIRFFYRSCQLILNQYQLLQKVPYENDSEVLKNLAQAGAPDPQKPAPRFVAVSPASLGTSPPEAEGKALRHSLQGSAAKIMATLKINAGDAKNALDSLEKLKSLPSPLETDQGSRKLRSVFSEVYWKIWEAAYKFYREQNGKVPQAIALMLEFGFFDEELLDDRDLAYLCRRQNDRSDSASYPILNSIEWMNNIYNKEEIPSIDSLGQSYFEKLKREHKNPAWKREKDIPETIDTPDRRLHCEIDTFLATNTRLTSGTPAACLPILNRHQLVLPIEKALLDKKYVNEKIKELLETDFSAFHREVILNDPDRGITKEFIQKQVFPYFIIIPSTGSRAMMWQEISGRNKSSPGRIVLPAFTTADLSLLLIHAVAAFRWEMTKTVMGVDWNNIGQPSLTADYTDYVQFYKKNRDISVEVRQKLASNFKRFRSDRDRFANDYSQWIKYESQGVLRLNKVVRSILYRHVPFSKNIRDKLADQPAFVDIHNRFRNIRTKQLRLLETRYRKFENDLPASLKANLEFHQI